MRVRRVAAAGTAIAAMLGMLTAGTAAATGPTQQQGVLATYQGRQIDLAQGWQGADVCSQDAPGAVTCYDLPAEAKLGTEPGTRGTLDDCPHTYACLWAHAGAEGRRLQFHDSGTTDLGDWDFRDQATGAYNNREIYGFELIDVRSFQPDRHLFVGVGQYVNLSKQSYPGPGSNWNDRVDKVHL
ncbi:peptidase inhibitor family I36 protein [Saccharopolyspora endophytica]|uniref:Peptidase inhibitor family I36 protein n=1 Tax=Saccharopolyspora endophytica TaxID=543886 RepID=A0ABS5DCW5_9PSEU|nr:peptidase inhibitor family I36 protein [Saccharopolyspora endophytica]MBQ0924132.1 peptidase inhibitor family I36 protein [Saccharopolyspora endophytica]